jgi:hypothetical protein
MTAELATLRDRILQVVTLYRLTGLTVEEAVQILTLPPRGRGRRLS